MRYLAIVRRFQLVSGVLIVGVIAFFGAAYWRRHTVFSTVDGPPTSNQRLSSEGVFVAFLTSSSCEAATDPVLPDLLERKLQRLSASAKLRNVGFGSVAIAIDADPNLGFAALSRLKGFQEYAAGAGRSNLTFESFFTGTNGGTSATPTLAIAIWDTAGEPERGRRLRVVKKLIGLDEIRRWANARTLESDELGQLLNR